jgi:hypothetical protein
MPEEVIVKTRENSLKKPNKRGYHLTSERAKELRSKVKSHGKAKKTLIKEEVWRQAEQKLMSRTLGLIDTQTIIAHGTIKIYKIVSHTVGYGKNKKTIKEKPELIINDTEISRVLDWEYGSKDDDPNTDEEYFFVSVQHPDNNAIKDQLNRIGLKSPDKIDITSGGKEIQQITGMEIIREPKKNESPI